MSYYKSINGVNYDKGLLDRADALTDGRGDGRISEKDAEDLFKDAMDGGKITRIERRTLEYILLNYNCTDAAITHMESRLYAIREGVRYDLVLIEAADMALEGRGDGRISQDDAETLWAMVSSDNLVTETERNTIRFIVTTYNCTDAARDFLLGKIMAI
jgi:hypothetical protein